MSINRIVSYKAFWAAALAIIFAGIGLLAACGGGGGTSASAIPPSSGAPPVVVPPTIPLATTCTATSGPLTLSAGAVRASGVAPLAIIFDATATIHTNPAVKTFHDIEYRWSFGDPGGNWATGSRPGAGNSRNSATGPVAAHVYENNGFYTIDVTAFDGTNTATCQILVTADDPDIVFAGAATTCISDTADFTGCPAGANQITTSNFATGVSAITVGNSVRRLLFRRGGTWSAATAGTILAPGPGIIGAFGGGPDPLVQAVTAFAAINPRAADWRIMDIRVDGGSATASGVLGDAGASQILLLRLSISNLHNGLVFSDFNALFDQIAVVDSSISNIIGGGGGQGGYIAASRFMFLGNTIDDTTLAEHGLRMPYANTAVISNNLFSRAAGTDGPAGAKTVLTIRAPNFDGTGVYPAGLFTEKVIVSDNKFVPHITQVGITGSGPQGNAANERIRDTIWERNWWALPASGDTIQIRHAFTASETTIRNNIVEVSGNGSDHRVFYVQMTNTVPGYPVPDQVRFYNNSVFSSDTGSNFGFVQLQAPITNITIKNNLVYAPGDAAPVLTFGTGASGIVIANNSSNANITAVSPAWTSPTPASPADFILTAPSYIAADPTVPVFSDFFRRARPFTAPMDIGATEF